MIFGRLKKLFLPVRGSSTVERILVKDTAEGSSPSPGAISRRKLFSFFGVGVAMLVKPDLFLPKRPSSITVTFSKVVPVVMNWDEGDREWKFWAALRGNEILQAVSDVPDGQALFIPGKWLPLSEVAGDWVDP